jgi:hypothetical protein
MVRLRLGRGRHSASTVPVRDVFGDLQVKHEACFYARSRPSPARRQAGFKSLGDAWADTTTSHGWLMLTVLAGLGRQRRGTRDGSLYDRGKWRVPVSLEADGAKLPEGWPFKDGWVGVDSNDNVYYLDCGETQ